MVGIDGGQQCMSVDEVAVLSIKNERDDKVRTIGVHPGCEGG